MIDCCSEGCSVTSLTLCHFFRGYLHASCRPKVRGTGAAHMLKLKDWPPRTAFRSKMPQLHADLMGSLPFQQYAHVDGVLNLARYLPADALAPDLGPKVRRGRCSRVQHEQPRGDGEQPPRKQPHALLLHPVQA